jgi:fatty-acyl-CoA synthase
MANLADDLEECRGGDDVAPPSQGEEEMVELITQAPTGTTMILRALARCPERMAFAWDGGSLTYRAALDLIGRLQAAMAAAGLKKGQTAAFLSANSAETWCAGVAAAGLGLIAT